MAAEVDAQIKRALRVVPEAAADAIAGRRPGARLPRLLGKETRAVSAMPA